MIQNGEEFADWIGSITGRGCKFVDPLWKPSRQARGIVFYERDTLKRICPAAIRAQRAKDRAKGKRAKGLRKSAFNQLMAELFAMFGLQHNWLHQNTADYSIERYCQTNWVGPIEPMRSRALRLRVDATRPRRWLCHV